MTSPAATDPDPMPQPPVPPDLDACCGNGCEPCIFDLHDLAMDQYRQAMRAWRARQEEPGKA
ncbi:oxidoreductase-like domain-containing protein [Paucibacter sp. O1-1]|uniref:oxidoreductase-like domain-containing protein n=1 Tax=unclassified Roseateles TaxID=2626991 RepID=UPI0021D49FFA|nr:MULTISPECIES: oxidoreductase-like domain-containing protein [unclassified Roseateles]MCU7371842.1 oxidoreductase-like domain-containing protein [Paucibacter sp. O1-1]MCZ7880948.1 oxidoreductase-like domain-containing protein [Paucibacter sp. M5-1]MDA3826832.1 oxidoreductase-like domain-containing protein [Paucibacter sp. O1-1]MDC6167350.1 oxidoreductase-like domain-containing protein [Paucibacter sp. XJ19-41]